MGHTLEARAEVGLLTHNVVVRGSNDPQWDDVIEACPAGFDTGEFATQTCFQGRFGEEIGSDQFGAQILFHAPVKDEDWTVGRIENVELTYVGQGFPTWTICYPLPLKWQHEWIIRARLQYPQLIQSGGERPWNSRGSD